MKKTLIAIGLTIFVVLSIVAIVYATSPDERIKPVTPENDTVYQEFESEFGCNANEHWDCVDDDTTDEASTKTICLDNAGGYYDFFNTNASFDPTHDIANVTVYYRACGRNSGSKACVWVNGAVSADCDASLDSPDTCDTYTTYSWFMDDNPDTATEWEWEEINGLLIGVQATDCNQDLHITQVWAEIGWEEPPGMCTGSNPYLYSGGDWIITGETICEDEALINVTGNLTIQGTGALYLINSNLKFNNTVNATNLTLESGGELYMNESSTIDTNETDVWWNLDANIGAGNITLVDSFINRSGWSATNSFYIHDATTAMSVILDNMTIQFGDTNNFTTIHGALINGTTFKNIVTNTIYLVNVNDTDITDNTILGNLTTNSYAVRSASIKYVNYTNITNNFIISGSSRTAVSWYAFGKNNTLENNDIYGGGSYVVAIPSSSGEYNWTISGNNIYTLGNGAEGLYMSYANQSRIFNNEFKNITDDGMVIANTYYANFSQNNVTIKSGISNVWGIVDTGGNGNIYFDNNFTVSSANGASLYSLNITFENNNITASQVGMELSGRFHTITGNQINATNGWAVHGHQGGNNTNFTNNRFISSFLNTSVRLNTTSNITFHNDTITSNPNYYDFTLTDVGTYATLINVTGNNATFTDNSELRMFWKLNVLVKNSSDENVIDGVNVTFENSTDYLYDWNITNATGHTDIEILPEYMENATQKYYETNYTINGTKSTDGFAPNSTEYNLTSSGVYTLYMTPGLQEIDRPVDEGDPMATLTEMINVTQDLTVSVEEADPMGTFTEMTNITKEITKPVDEGDPMSTLTEMINTSQELARNVSEDLTYSEMINISQDLTRTVDEGDPMGTFSEMINTTFEISRAVDEGDPIATLTEMINISQELTRNVSDTATLTEMINITQDLSRNISESLSFDEMINITTAQTYDRPVDEGDPMGTFTEMLNTSLEYTRNASESLSLAEMLNMSQEMTRNVSESLAFTDMVNMTTVQTYDRPVNESDPMGTLTEMVNVSQDLNRNMSESLSLSEMLNTSLEYERIPSESLTLSEMLNRTQKLTRGIEEDLSITEMLNSTRGYTRSATEDLSGQFNEMLNRTQDLTISVTEDLSSQFAEMTNASTTGDQTRTASESLSFSEMVNTTAPAVEEPGDSTGSSRTVSQPTRPSDDCDWDEVNKEWVCPDIDITEPREGPLGLPFWDTPIGAFILDKSSPEYYYITIPLVLFALAVGYNEHKNKSIKRYIRKTRKGLKRDIKKSRKKPIEPFTT